MPRVTETIPTGKCACGKTNRDCCAWWDKHLKITDHASDAQSGTSAYHRNLMSIATAKAKGEDPYHNRLNSRSGH